jgi:hypothetical protein
MRPTQHISNTRVLGAPKGWNQAELPCGALPITDINESGRLAVLSFWRPSTEELAILNNGGLVTLCIPGTSMPPAALGVEPAVDAPNPIKAALLLALRQATAQQATAAVMEQAQVFASAWALVGGRFDAGDGMALANQEKAALQDMVASLAQLAAKATSSPL